MSEPDICSVGGGGLVLPLFGDGEQEWPRGLRIVLYMLGLFWCFIGVAIIADVFMSAIEKVTSKKYRKWDAAKGRHRTVELWNPTVANLTLMALGSSAPEILLNVIDIFAKEFFLEGLGPSTIVGSAAFNLLMIIAVCIVAIPNGEVRYIKEVPVYVCTATWSIFAYVWLLIILMGTSPNVVTLWEGTLTFLFFPILTLSAFAADKGYFGSMNRQEQAYSVSEDTTAEEIAEVQAKVRAEHGEHLTNEQVAKIIMATSAKRRSPAHYRIAAIRSLCGGKRLKTVRRSFTTTLSKKFSFLSSNKRVFPCDDGDDSAPTSWIQFHPSHYAVLESAGHVTVKVSRTGDVSMPARAWYSTKDGTATAESDYKPVQGWVEFQADETEAEIKISIIDDNAYEEDEEFFVVLSQAEIVQTADCKDKSSVCVLGENKKATILIIDDDDAGVLCFEKEEMTASPQVQDYKLEVKVRRSKGGCGEVSVQYRTEDATARAGRDYEEASGTLKFAHQQIEASFEVTIKAVARYDLTDSFRVIISDPEGGAQLDDTKDGSKEWSVCTVTLAADEKARENVDRIRSTLKATWDKSKIGRASWAAQFKDALYVNGGEDEDDDDGSAGEGPSMMEYVSHGIALPWKLLFALVPPVDYCGGWVCFCCALMMIGFVTMIIGDMASLLGCVLQIPDDITAITFVALGTSLPDTFASKSAATQDPYADASVGNVTGSNSVNVFLGLGLPWMIAAINWQVAGANAKWQERYQMLDGLDWLGEKGFRTQAFVVEAGSLGFSVTIFSTFAVLCIVLLAVRRATCGGELGGEGLKKWVSGAILVFLWLLYIILSAWKSLSSQ